MGVVQLDRSVIGKNVPIIVLLAEPVEDVLERRRDEQIFLLQPKLPAFENVVAGVQDARDVLGKGLVFAGPDVVAVVEIIQLELLRGLGREQPKRVHRVRVVSRHGRVVGHGEDVVRIDPAKTRLASLVLVRLHTSVELHGEGVFGAGDLPWIAEAQPVVRLLDLVAVATPLLEHAVFVSDPVTIPGQAQRRHRVQKACCQTSKSAVTQARVLLYLANLLQVVAELH